MYINFFVVEKDNMLKFRAIMCLRYLLCNKLKNYYK